MKLCVLSWRQSFDYTIGVGLKRCPDTSAGLQLTCQHKNKKGKMHKLASKRRERFLFLLICDRLSLSMGTVVWLVKIAIKCPCQANIVRAFIFLDQQRNGLRNRRERDRQLSFPLVMVVALCGVAVVVAGCLVCVEKCSFVLFSSSSSVLLCFTTGGYILHPAI